MVRAITFSVICVIILYSQRLGALEVNRAPFGTVTINEGTGRIQTGSYELVIVHQKPESLQRQFLTPLLQQVEGLLATAQQGQVLNLDPYRTRLSRLQSPARVKRGLINAVGELTKTLFGIATSKDVDKIKNVVNELVMESNTRKVVVRDLIVCVNRTMAQQRQIREKVNALADHVNKLQDSIMNLAQVHDELGIRVYNAEMLIAVETVLSLAEEVHNMEKENYHHFQYKKDLAVIGHLTESLLPRSVLRNIRNHVKIALTDEYLYTNLEVKIMRLDGDSLGYWVSLPILDGESYTLWRILTVPFPVGNGANRQLIPEVTTLGRGLETGNYIEADLCKFENPRLCPSPVEYTNLECVSSILQQRDEQSKHCKVVEVDAFTIRVKRVTPVSVVIATNGEKIEERCHLRSPKTYDLTADAYLLTVEAGCVLEGDNWRFQATTIESSNIEIQESVVLLPVQFNISIDLPDKLPNIEYNFTDVKHLIDQDQVKVPDVNSMKTIHYVTISGSVAGYLALVFILCCIIIVFVYRYVKKCRNESGPTTKGMSDTGITQGEQKDSPKSSVFGQFCGSGVKVV